MSPSRSLVSVVVPVYNGADLLEELHRELSPVLDALDADSEVVYVDDGSHDRSLEVLRALQLRDPRIRIVELVTNFGQHAAISAGFDVARGSAIVTMDADLQCDPRDMPKLLAPLAQGYDLASGVRTARADSLVRRALSRVANSLVAGMTRVKGRDVGCPFNALTADVARNVAEFGELRRFLKPLIISLSRRVIEVEVTHRPRPNNQPRSSYSATGLVRLFMDFLVNTVGDVFAWVFVIATALCAIALVVALASGVGAVAGAVGGWVPVAAFAVAGVALAAALFGLAADYIQRIYRQSSRRPFYLVRQVHEAAALQSMGRGR